MSKWTCMAVWPLGIFLLIAACFPVKSERLKICGLSYIDGLPICIETANGLIASISRPERLPAGTPPLYLAPGLFDNQVNGGSGVYFSSENPLTPDEIRKVVRSQWSAGVTSFLPTLTSHTRQVLKRNLEALARWSGYPEFRGTIPGFHLEGPYISPEDGYRGAHARQFVREPDVEELMELQRASGNKILTVTLAPERPGAMELIRWCTQDGIVVALGHHNASAGTIRTAVRNGARIATHLGNGCANLIHRHENPLWPQLADDSLMISIIADGFHLTAEEIKTFYKVKGAGKIVITSDITRYAGLTPGIYSTADGRKIELTPAGKVQYPAQGVLAGSALAVDTGVKKVMNFTGASLEEAIRMSSTNVARLYGLEDRGRLREGMRADIILFSLGRHKLDIHRTFVAGALVFEQDARK